MQIEINDDERYIATDIGNFTFQKDSSTPLTLKYVMFVPGLKNNFVLVAMLGDHGYGVIYRKGKGFLHHKAMGQVKKIWVRVKNLYKLDVEDCVALSKKAEKVQSRDNGDKW